MVRRLAAAWESLDTETAVGCFAPAAVYMEPPDIQLYIGHEQLRPYFGALQPGTRMRVHHVWFDPVHQLGVLDYTFGLESAPEAVHGVSVVEVEDGLITRWREYQRPGPASRETFLDTDGEKVWKWTIANYP